MYARIKYDFSAKLWQHSSPGGWYFVSLPKTISKEIRKNFQDQEEGWGRMKALACINHIEWDTAIWYDTKKRAYLLPVKAEIRNKARLKPDEIVSVCVSI